MILFLILALILPILTRDRLLSSGQYSISAVIDHMICYNLNRPRIKLQVQNHLLLRFTSYPQSLEDYSPTSYKVRSILELIYVAGYVNYYAGL